MYPSRMYMCVGGNCIESSPKQNIVQYHAVTHDLSSIRLSITNKQRSKNAAIISALFLFYIKLQHDAFREFLFDLRSSSMDFIRRDFPLEIINVFMYSKFRDSMRQTLRFSLLL